MALDLATVQRKFGLPQQDAAKELGISLTSLKQVCRKLGISRWPYYRLAKHGGTRRNKSSKEARALAGADAGDTEHGTNNLVKSYSPASCPEPGPLSTGSIDAIQNLCETALRQVARCASSVSANPSLVADALKDAPAKALHMLLYTPPSYSLAELDDAASGMIGASLLHELSQSKFANLKIRQATPPTTLPPLSSILNYGLGMGRVERGGEITPFLQGLTAAADMQGQAIQGSLQYPSFFPSCQSENFGNTLKTHGSTRTVLAPCASAWSKTRCAGVMTSPLHYTTKL